MEYIRIYILDIKNEEENIGNLKQLNLTLIFDKSLLQIVPRKHFCILFFRSFNYGWFLSWYFCITFKTNQKIGGHHQVSKTGMVEHFKIALGNRFGTVVPRTHFIYKKKSENVFKFLKKYPNLNIWYTILVNILCSHFFLILPLIFTIYNIPDCPQETYFLIFIHIFSCKSWFFS